MSTWQRAAACGVLLVLPSVLLANHGPGASGGGAFTISGETLKPGNFELSLREDFSDFEHFDSAAAAQRAKEGGDFDALDHGFLTTADIAYGVTEDFQIGASIGYFLGSGFISASQEDDGSISKQVMADGLHPTKEGYERWAKAMNPTLEEMLK